MNAYELVTTLTSQEQFLERGRAITPCNDSGSSLSCARASRPEVERFAGATDPNMAWCWINRLEKFFDEMVYPNDKRIVWAAALLDGDAHYWWMSITRGYEEPSSITWTKFLTHFFNKYINSGARLAIASSTEFRPLVKFAVSCGNELRSHPRSQVVNCLNEGPFKRATSDSLVKSRTSPINNTRNHGGSWKRQKTHQQTPKVAVAPVRVEPMRQVAHLKCFNCGELGHFSNVCTNPKNLACFKCGQSGHIGRECTHQQTPTKVAVAPAPVRVEPMRQVARLKCFNCGELGHFSNVCTNPQNLECFKCGQSGHIGRECTHQQPPTKVAVSPVRVEPIRQVAHLKCFNCGEIGHISNVCIKPKNSTCFKCGQSGHVVKECIQSQRNR